MSDVNNLNKKKTHEEIKDQYEYEIYKLVAEEKYIDCINTTKEYLEYLKKTEDEIKDYVLWKWNYIIGINYNFMNDTKNDVNYADIAIDYVNYEEDTTNDDFIKTLWLYASSYRKKGNIKKAVEMYDNVAKYYDKVNHIAYALENKYMVAQLSGRLDEMIEIAREYENNKAVIEKDEKNKKEYDNIICSMYKRILEMSLETEDKEKYLNILDNIQCETTKSKLKKII